MKEFCLFASVAIVIDFLLQITFFVTILSIDIRRLELSDLHKLKSVSSSDPKYHASKTLAPNRKFHRVKRMSNALVLILIYLFVFL